MKLLIRYIWPFWGLFFLLVFMGVDGKAASKTEDLKLMVQNGPYGIVHMSDFSPDGKLIATASGDSMLRIWDVETGRLLKVMNTDRSPMLAVAFAPDNIHVATGKGGCSSMEGPIGACDNRIEIWDTFKGKSVQTIKRKKGFENEVRDLAFGRNGKYLVCGAVRYEIYVSKGTYKYKFYKKLNVVGWALNFSHDGNLLASGNISGNVSVWNAENWKLERQFKVDPRPASYVEFTRNNAQLVTISSGDSATIWDLKSGNLQKTYKFSEGFQTSRGAALSQDDSMVIVGNTGGKIRVVDLDTGTTKYIFGRADVPNPFFSIFIFKKDGVHSFFQRSGKIINSQFTKMKMPPEEEKYHLPVDGIIEHLDHHPAKPLVSVSYHYGVVDLWNYDTARLDKEIGGKGNLVYTLAFSPDGEYLLTGGDDNSVKQWGLEANKSFKVFKEQKKFARIIKFSPDGKRIATGDAKPQTTLWDVDPDTLISNNPSGNGGRLFKDDSVVIYDVVFHPRQPVLAYFDHNGLVLVNTNTGKKEALLTEKDVDSGELSMAISLDGNTIASGHDDLTLNLWNLKKKKRILRITDNKSRPLSLAFHPKQSLLFVANADHTITVWETRTGLKIKSLTGHTGSVNSLVFNRNGSRLYSAGGDGLIHVWNNKSTKPILSFRDTSQGFFQIALSPDGSVLASGGHNITLWNTQTSKKLATLWSFDKDSWIVTQGNKFDGSEKGLEKLHFVKGLQQIPNSVYRKQYHRPNLLSSVFKGKVFSVK